MSVERPTATPAAAAERSVNAERSGGVELNASNRATYAALSEGAKGWAHRLYEGVRATPLLGNAVGRMELAFSNRLTDRAQERTLRVKNKLDANELQKQALVDSRGEIEAMITDLQQSGVPGAERLQAQLRKLDQRINTVDTKHDLLQSKFEARQNKTKQFVNRRDAIADSFINKYEQKLSPLEAKLEAAHASQKEIDLEIAAAEARHEATKERLEAVKTKRVMLEQTYQKIGMSERKINRDAAIKQLDAFVAEGQARIEAEKRALAEQKARVAKKVAAIDKKANPYRDRRNEFNRVKADRPVMPEAAARREVPVHEGTEEIISPSRPNPESSAERRMEQMQANDFVAQWNKYLLDDESGAADNRHLINPVDFLRASRLTAGQTIAYDNFVKLLDKYFKFRNRSTDGLEAAADAFYEKHVKQADA